MASEVARTMSKIEAREAADLINQSLEDTGKLLLDFYEKEGWKALDYASWRECVVAEFGKGKSQLYNQLEAARIERQISTRVENGHLPVKPLLELKRLPENKRDEAWQEAVAKAQMESLQQTR